MARTRRPRLSWVRWFWSDFDGGTKLFSDAEVGQYVRLMHLQLDSGKAQAIPPDLKELRRIIGSRPTARVLKKFDTVEVDGEAMLQNDRMAQEAWAAFEEVRGKSGATHTAPPGAPNEKARAHGKVGKAIRDGHLVRRPCEVCGHEEAIAHHDDYSKPLEVRWLCSVHHGRAHSANDTPAVSANDTPAHSADHTDTELPDDTPHPQEPSPSPSVQPDPPQTTDNGLSAPPAPTPPCPRCGRSDTPCWDSEDGTWMCAIDAGGAPGCGQRFKPPDRRTPEEIQKLRKEAAAVAPQYTPSPLPKKRKGGYVGRACDLWTEIKGGVVAPGRMGSALKPLVADVRKRNGLASDAETWEKIEPSYVAYLETTDDRYCSPEAFAKAPRSGSAGGSAKARAREDGMRAEIEGGLRDE